LKNRKGSSGFLGVLAAVPVVILTILIIVQVVGSLDSTMGSMDFGADGNATRDAVFSNTWNGLNMVPIVVIILFASVILGAIGLLGLGRGG
jgi:hypothetical protein